MSLGRPSLLLPLGRPQLKWSAMRWHSPVSLRSHSSFVGIFCPLSWECSLKSVSLWAEGRGSRLWKQEMLCCCTYSSLTSSQSFRRSISYWKLVVVHAMASLLTSVLPKLLPHLYSVAMPSRAHFHQPLQNTSNLTEALAVWEQFIFVIEI